MAKKAIAAASLRAKNAASLSVFDSNRSRDQITGFPAAKLPQFRKSVLF
jgi:hypothetical protein